MTVLVTNKDHSLILKISGYHPRRNIMGKMISRNSIPGWLDYLGGSKSTT
jgi:hypothetical protein